MKPKSQDSRAKHSLPAKLSPDEKVNRVISRIYATYRQLLANSFFKKEMQKEIFPHEFKRVKFSLNLIQEN